MKKILLCFGVVLAGLLSSGNASAGFVMIDTFTAAGFGVAVEGGVRDAGSLPNIGLTPGGISGGVATIRATGASIFYTPLVGMQGNNAFRLNGITGADAGTRVTATVAGAVNASAFVDFVGGETEAIIKFNTSLQGITEVTFATSNGGLANFFTVDSIEAVPEPTTMALLGLAAVGSGGAYVRRRRRASAE